MYDLNISWRNKICTNKHKKGLSLAGPGSYFLSLVVCFVKFGSVSVLTCSRQETGWLWDYLWWCKWNCLFPFLSILHDVLLGLCALSRYYCAQQCNLELSFWASDLLAQPVPTSEFCNVLFWARIYASGSHPLVTLVYVPTTFLKSLLLLSCRTEY